MQRLKQQLIDSLKKHLDSGKQSDIPIAGRTLWGIFATLLGTRTYSSSGPNPITFCEIKAYCELYQVPLQPQHVDIIIALDNTWLEYARAEFGTGTGSKPKGQKIAGDLTSQTFDAFF